MNSSLNALQNRNGFSPNQLVFGYNVNLPTVLTDLPPALELTTSSDIIRKNLNALHDARKNYIQAESSEKIRRALKHKTRTYADEVYNINDKVFYKRKNLKGWRGPAIVTGVDGKIILVRHGSAYYKCHPCHLMKVVQQERKSVEGKHREETFKEKEEEIIDSTSKKKTESEESSEKEDISVRVSGF